MSYHMIESHLHGKVLNVHGGYPSPGAQITLWSKIYPVPQNELFFFQDVGGGWFHIASALDPNMVLDVEGGYGNPGSRLILWHRKYPAAPNQLFRWHGEALQSQLGGDLVLDVDGGDTCDGTACIIYNHKGGYASNQSWRLSH